MSDETKALIEKMRRYRMTSQELMSQTISFAHGNGHIEDSRVSREGVTRVVLAMSDTRTTESSC